MARGAKIISGKMAWRKISIAIINVKSIGISSRRRGREKYSIEHHGGMAASGISISNIKRRRRQCLWRRHVKKKNRKAKANIAIISGAASHDIARRRHQA